MARPTFGGAAGDYTVASTGDATITVGRPPNTATGDLLVFAILPWRAEDPVSIVTATGTDATKVSHYGTVTSSHPAAVFFYRVVTDVGSEPADYAFTGFQAWSTRAFALRITGQRATNPVVVGNGGHDTNTVNQFTIPSMSTDIAEPLRITGICFQKTAALTITPGTIIDEDGGCAAAHDDAPGSGEVGSVLLEWVDTGRVAAGYVLVSGEAAGPTLETTRHRWRNDDGDEATATWRENEGVATTASIGETVRLRKQIQATGDPGSTSVELRFRKKGTADPWDPLA